MGKALLSELQSWHTRIAEICTTHQIEDTGGLTPIISETKIMASDMQNIADAIEVMSQEEHLATATVWNLGSSELSVGSRILQSTVDGLSATLTSMESKTHYTRVINSAGTTYTMTSNTALTTFTQTSNSHTTYSSNQLCTNGYYDSITSHTNGTYYSQTSNRASQGCSSQVNDGVSGYSSRFSGRVLNTNTVTYSRTSHTAVVKYSPDTLIRHTNGYASRTATDVPYTRTTHSATTSYSQTTHSATTTYSES